jgi:hypothetical protein
VKTAPSVSAMCGREPLSVSSTNRCIVDAAGQPRHSDDGDFVAELGSRGRDIGGPRLHTGHHGAQNQKTAGLPARLAPSNVPPSIVRGGEVEHLGHDRHAR